jgi:signal-transduction protein with cAMP-binding, CBS, and nucleotidyltransferase domain
MGELVKPPSIVADIMSSPVTTIDGEVSVRDSSQTMIDKQIGSIIVTEHDQPRGIVTERDLVERVVAPCRDPNQTKIKEIMSTPLITISKETGILDAMRKMRKKDISRLVVMDDGTLIGLISEKDVIRAVTISSITSFSTLLRKRR